MVNESNSANPICKGRVSLRINTNLLNVCSRHPNGITEAQYQRIVAGNSMAKGWGWPTMRHNPGFYVKGRIRHADHATITLHGWHRVLMKTEDQSKAMPNVAFRD